MTTAALRKLLGLLRAIKDGHHILIEMSDQLLMEWLRQRVRQLGFLSDGSFSGAIAKIPGRALAALIADLVPVAEQASIKARLRATGVSGDDFQSMIAGLLGNLSKRVAGAASEQIAEHKGSKIGAFIFESASTGLAWLRRDQ